jgi:hypothetical protein
MGENIEQ